MAGTMQNSEDAVLSAFVAGDPKQTSFQSESRTPLPSGERTPLPSGARTPHRANTGKSGQDGFASTLECSLTDLRRSLLNEHKRVVQRYEQQNIQLRRQLSRKEGKASQGPSSLAAPGSSSKPPQPPAGTQSARRPSFTSHTSSHGEDIYKSEITTHSQDPMVRIPSKEQRTPSKQGWFVETITQHVRSPSKGSQSSNKAMKEQKIHPEKIHTVTEAKVHPVTGPKVHPFVSDENVHPQPADKADGFASSSDSSNSSTESGSAHQEDPEALERVMEDTARRASRDSRGSETASMFESQRKSEIGGSMSFNVLPGWICNANTDTESRSASMTSYSSLRQRSQNFEHDEDGVTTAPWENWMAPFMLYPSSRVYLFWDIFGLLLVVRDILLIPLQILDPMDSVFNTFLTWVARLFWTSDIGISFVTGYVSSQGIVELRPRQVARHYIKTRLPQDLFIVICDWLEAFLGAAEGLELLGILRAMRLVRLIRLIKNQRSILEFMIRSEWLTLVASVQASLVLLLALIHVIACVWYGIQVNAHDESYFASDSEKSALVGSLLEKYTFCFHVVLALFLGEHLVMAELLVERIFTVVVLFFAFVVGAAFVGSLTTAMTRLQIIASQRSAQFAALSNYLSDYEISRDLALRVQRNARHALNEQKRNTPESNVALLALISDQLRAEIHYEVNGKHLLVHAFIKFLNESHSICIRLICHNAVSTVSLSRGDVIFSEFEVPSEQKMFFTVSGRLGYSQSAVEQENIAEGQWIAEPMLWTSWVHRGTCQAMTECRFLVLDGQKFNDCVSMYRTPKRFACKYAARYIDDLNRTHETQMTDIGNAATTNEMVSETCLLETNKDQTRRSMGGRMSLAGAGTQVAAAGMVNRMRRASLNNVAMPTVTDVVPKPA